MGAFLRRLRLRRDEPVDDELTEGFVAPARDEHTRRFSPRSFLALMPTVAVLLLALLGYLLIWQHFPETSEETWQPALVRALAAVPGEVSDEAFVVAKFSSEELPAGNTEALYYRLTMQPGAQFSDLAMPVWCGCLVDLVDKGVGVEVVRSGAYTMRLDTPLRLQRHGAQEVTTVPAQTEVTLEQGDAVIISDYTATGEMRNAGHDPVVVTGLAIFSTEDSDRPAPRLPEGVRAQMLTYAMPWDWRRLPTGPVRVSVRELTLPAGATIGPYQPVGLEAMWVEQGTTYRGLYAPGATEPSQPVSYRGKEQTLPFLGATSGVRHEIAIGDEPAELLVVIIEPAGMTPQMLAP